MASPLMPIRSRTIEEQITAKLAEPTAFSSDELRQQGRWIRDILDPQVAQEGQDALHSDEILTLDELLRKLLDSDISLEDIRYSRMHLAIRDIAGRATRWPKKLADRCDSLNGAWETRYGPLGAIRTLLYEPGGRLHGICEPQDLSKEKLLVKWLKSPEAKLSPAVARRKGSLGFTPGDWWISPLFAHRAGIVDSGSSEGGIISDATGAYAVVMTNGDELPGSTPEMFQYRARDRDPGRYRLTAGTPESRHPIRILRSHSLHSFWKPRAGLRYDGLHKVTGWTLKKETKTNETVLIITFKRLSSENSMDSVMCRPWSDEVEDYVEYNRIRKQYHVDNRDTQHDAGRTRPTASTVLTDGTSDGAAPTSPTWRTDSVGSPTIEHLKMNQSQGGSLDGEMRSRGLQSPETFSSTLDSLLSRASA